MKQEDKDLVSRYLSMALPYGVKILHEGWDYERDCECSSVETLIGINDRFVYTLRKDEKDKHSICEPLSVLDYKPFLRPMSSMTEEEKKKYGLLCFDVSYYERYTPKCSYELIKWLLERHFDFMGLIAKGLALEAPKEMY